MSQMERGGALCVSSRLRGYTRHDVSSILLAVHPLSAVHVTITLSQRGEPPYRSREREMSALAAVSVSARVSKATQTGLP